MNRGSCLYVTPKYHAAETSKKAIKRSGRRDGLRRVIHRCMIAAAIILAAIFIIRSVRAGADEKPSYKYYTSIEVQSGDTLWDIADRYMTEPYSGKKEYIKEVISINHLPDDTIYAGRKICIPYYSTEKK